MSQSTNDQSVIATRNQEPIQNPKSINMNQPSNKKINFQSQTDKMESIDASKLDALSLEIIKNQATINIGTLGHVSHGKSTLVEALTGIKTIRHTSEKERNITIKLGYANFKVYKCDRCPKPECYKSFGSNQQETALPCTTPECSGTMHLIRHFSFVDCPGHECLMSTMLNGAAVMDGAVLVVASNEVVPRPQTAEHLIAAEIMQLQNLVTIQTKLDLVEPAQAMENHKQIKSFLKGTSAEKSPVIPVCCSPLRRVNIDVVLQYLCENVPVPKRQLTDAPHFSVVRSFDVNVPGEDFARMKGGVAGGTLKRGILRVGQQIEIRPGLITKDSDGKMKCAPIITRVVSLFSEKNSLQFAAPGGLIAIGTTLDPTLTKGDRLVGQTIGLPGLLPDVFQEIELQSFLLRTLFESSGKPEKVKKLAKGETLLLNVASSTTHAKVIAVKNNHAKLFLAKPACIELNEHISLSRNINGAWHLIGYGEVTHGIPMPLDVADEQRVVASAAIEETMEVATAE